MVIIRRKSYNVIIGRYLYGLNSTVAAWQAQISHTMLEIIFASCLFNPYFWMQKDTKPYGFKYCKYFLICTGVMLKIYHDSCVIMGGVTKVYDLKNHPETNQMYYDPKR